MIGGDGREGLGLIYRARTTGDRRSSSTEAS